MLGKLTKHELIASGRMIVPLYLALIFATLIGKLFIWLSSKEVFLESVSASFSRIVGAVSSLLTILCIFLIFAIIVATIIFIIIRFYKNYFTDEGYLMLTLPVRTSSLVLSKLFSAVLWSIVSFAVAIGAFLFIMNSEETASSFKMFWREFMSLLERISPEMNIPVWGIIVEAILIFLLAIIGNYLMFYTAIAAGPSFSIKNRVVGSIVAYVIIYILVQIVSGIMVYVLSTVMPDYIATLSENAGSALQSTILSTGSLNLLLCLVFFFITNHLIKTKTNLE